MENTNYTQEMTDDLVQAYVASPSRAIVDQYAEAFGKSPRSIIAKLVREGVYQAPQRVTKTGQPVVRKQELVEKIEAATGFAMPSLEKASKGDLTKLVEYFEAVTAEQIEASLKEALTTPWQE